MSIVKLHTRADEAREDMLDLLSDCLETVESGDCVSMAVILVGKDSTVRVRAADHENTHHLTAGTVYLQRMLVDEH